MTRPGKQLQEAEAEFGNYDVFISHSGPDTKKGFVSFLYGALKKAGLHPFLDCKSIGKGQDSWECIAHAIRTTSLALVIFSKSFAQSEWCLKELHVMLDNPSVKVLPIFYNVQPWDVKFPEKGQLAVGFKKLTKGLDKTLIEEWTADLKRASTINGWEFKVEDKRLEANLVQKVVGKISELANKPLPLNVGDYIVGVKQVAKNLIQTFSKMNFLMLGLWGMGGIGKSTLAQELYNQLEKRSGVRCYVEDVVEKVSKYEVTTVQNYIMETLCGDGLPAIVNKSKGKAILEERLSNKRFLVVLDDVRDSDVMNYLISREMLKRGSMCIVTSRNRCVFEKSTSFPVSHEVYTHEVQTLGLQDSRSVFALYAFGGDTKVPRRFGGLVGAISNACGGVPLVLKVFGCLLRDSEVEIWEEVLEKLNCDTKMDNENKIFNCLWISSDTLNEQEKEMFLDIACALLGAPVELAKFVWRSQRCSTALGVRNLVEKALIRVDDEDAFAMHDVLRDMGREISKQERPSERRRLWASESLALLDEEKPLLDSLETLVLPWRLGLQVDLSLMKGLRILKWIGGFVSLSSLPQNLRWLELRKHNIESEEDFAETLENSKLEMWFRKRDLIERLPESFGNLRMLEVLNLSYCSAGLELPNSFGGLQNLKNLDLIASGIESLPESFGNLRKLVVLELAHCGGLIGLPDSFGGLRSLKDLNLFKCGIKSLPESFGMLSSLEYLSLLCCYYLDELPNSFGGLRNLKHLDLGSCSIQSLPQSFGTLSNLEVLNLEGCDEFVEISDWFGDLQKVKDLDLSGTKLQRLPKSFGALSNLEGLCLSGCNELVMLPDFFGGLQNLKHLELRRSKIQSLPESFGSLCNLTVLDLRGCDQLVELPDSIGGLRSWILEKVKSKVYLNLLD